MSRRLLATLVPAMLITLAGCPEEEKPGGSGAGTTSATGDGGAGGGAGGGGPVVRIHLRADAKPFPHDDGLAGETPIAHSSGMRKFQLFRDVNDPSPVTIFDYGTGFVEAGYDDGDDTVVATVPIQGLPAGTFTVGRVVHSHVRYQVAATVHAFGLDLPGQLDNVQVMSDGTLLDGVMRNHGYYEYAFTAGGQSYSTKGENAPEPTFPTSGGFSVKIENGEWAYWFPVSLTLSPDVPVDVDMVMHVNMFESFRWMDQAGQGFATGVFDVTPASFEPVLRFGANSFSVYAE